ncbi:MAG: hypothetical protein H6719_06230 [Sandaracinaceae bacterium]|nr:hypothetical protein [Sandaracinaceae bacterium]
MASMVELNFNPSDRTLRQFGWIALGGFGLLAALAWFELGMFSFGLGNARPAVAGALGAVGVLSALLSLVYPKANRILFVSLSVVTFPIGFVLSYVIMGLLFFGMFAPIAIAFRVLGRDALRRRGATSKATSHWEKARPARPKSDYFKQY